MPGIRDYKWLEVECAKYLEFCRETERKLALNSGNETLKREYPTIVGLAKWLDIPRKVIEYRIAKYLELMQSDEYQKSIDILSLKPYDTSEGCMTIKIGKPLFKVREQSEQTILQAYLNSECDGKAAALVLSGMGYRMDSDLKPEHGLKIVIEGAKDISDLVI